MRLAKAGYYNGNPEKILTAPIDIIINILEYEKYEADLIQAYEDIRKEDS